MPAKERASRRRTWTGWLAEEMRALGTLWERRGKRLDAYVAVMKALWCEDPSAYEDEFYSLPSSRFAPKPVQTPHPPLIFGGESDAALRRIAAVGQGWNAAMKSPEQMTVLLAKLDSFLAECGRSREELEIICMPGVDLDVELASAYRQVGVDQLVAYVMAPRVEEVRSFLEPLAKALQFEA